MEKGRQVGTLYPSLGEPLADERRSESHRFLSYAYAAVNILMLDPREDYDVAADRKLTQGEFSISADNYDF